MRRRSPLTVTVNVPWRESGDPSYRESLATVTDADLESLLLRWLKKTQRAQDDYIKARSLLNTNRQVAGDIEQVLRSRGPLSEAVETALRDTYPVGP